MVPKTEILSPNNFEKIPLFTQAFILLLYAEVVAQVTWFPGWGEGKQILVIQETACT